MPSMAATDVTSIAGVVQEVLATGHYTYFRIRPEQGADRWAVVFGATASQPGDPLSLRVHGHSADFHSRRLGRDFKDLYFAGLADPA